MKAKRCKQCENPNLKGLHTCGRELRHARKQETLVNRLRAPIHRLDDFGTPHASDLADKVNAIGEALAYIIEKKHMKKRVQQRGG